MKVQNTPVAYGFLAGLLVLLFGLLAVDAGCAHVHKIAVPAGTHTRTLKEQEAAAVSIFTECGSGSGVIVDERRVLTAFHVVNCGKGHEIKLAETLVLRTLSGKIFHARVDVGDPDRDEARLWADADMPATPITIRKITNGESACAMTAVPERAARCGIVNQTDNEPRSVGDIFIAGANVWFGNSGSGVYAADGTLVGILVRLRYCNAEDQFFAQFGERPVTCGGYVTSITDSQVMP